MRDDPNNLRFAIVIPAYNEDKNIESCLVSLLNQSLKPKSIIVVDDSSTDKTAEVVKAYEKSNTIIKYMLNPSLSKHEPGSKVIRAFNTGLKRLDLKQYDIICKFDADLIFPPGYLSELSYAFNSNPNLGLCGGVCAIKLNSEWKTENLTNTDHVRGALKAYRTQAFLAIEGLATQMGWDTADEFKLRYKDWEIEVLEDLKVKHLKPTASVYNSSFLKKQGQVFFALRYGLFLTVIAALKIAFKQKNMFKTIDVIQAYIKSKRNNVEYLLTVEEGMLLRKYRWKQIWRKLIP